MTEILSRGCYLMISFRTVVILLLLLSTFVDPVLSFQRRRRQPTPEKTELVKFSAPEIFTYEELLKLAEDPIPQNLKAKLDKLLSTPFVSNEAYFQGAKPIQPNLPQLGSSLRIVMWNIERGLNLDDIIAVFTNKEAFLKKIDTNKVKPESSEYRKVLEEIEVLQSADLLILNELDWGIKRSKYKEVVKELGQATNMNWAYGVEFIEIDPINLGTETFEEVLPEDREAMKAAIAVDKSLYKGLHGTAILSRYPIREAKLQPLKTKAFDWYKEQKAKVSLPEKGKRQVSEKIFLEKIQREVRRGGRTLLTVTLDVDELPEKKLTVVAPHLENNCKPACRQQQMDEILGYIKNVTGPVVMAGDLNTTFRDGTPTSFKREFTRRLGSSEFWTGQGIKYVTGVGLVFDVLKGGISFIKNHNDPTVKHVPVVAPNPEEKLFKKLEDFRFADNYRFDFRGDKDRSFNELEGTLANSNERASKGFAVTFEVERTVGPVGKLKLDWIFVKPYITDPRNSEDYYRFAPHFARTMEEINYSVADRMSDHNPISVDLPFKEPDVEKLKNTQARR
ncbi:MAG: endonuclease/exonuclease/phosphatase family protein [Blastocatellia bacterium]|nr:endonuclease/exonuclease/phosphatase family protein [Blastocatellia bacterium]